jgi:hypothetical protein
MEERRIQAEIYKEWSRQRDDLECDDLKVPTEIYNTDIYYMYTTISRNLYRGVYITNVYLPPKFAGREVFYTFFLSV